jgi:hypothetical protein
MKLAALAAGLALAAGAALAADDAPPWVRAEAARPAPSYPVSVAHVALLQEETLTVAPDGRRVMRERGVIRILQRSRESITAWRAYNTKTGRIRDFKAWLVTPGARDQTFKADQILDVALSTNFTYDEGRAKSLQCPATAAPGSVFAYEVVEEEKTVFTQYPYYFQGRMPVLVSRFVLTLPPGWEQRAVVFNHAPIEPAVNAGVYTWELRDLPWIEAEPHNPGLGTMAPRLGVTCIPPKDNSAGLRALTDWRAVGEWLSTLQDPPSEPDDAIRARAAALTAGAATPLDKIRAIAAFVQKVNYVSVQMDVTRGGGYTPHGAGQVLSRNYGDCKDKAALMKALLKAAGIDAHMVGVYSGDRMHVRPEWPSPLQFNHAIVAIRADGVDAPGAAADHPRLGHLLWFDPTDPYTPLGDLPREEQGSRMLLVAGDKSDLVTAPLAPISAQRIESEVQARLEPGGLLHASLRRDYRGAPATFMRADLRQNGPEEFRRSFEGAFAQRVGRIKLGALEPSDRAEGGFHVKLDYDVEQFGKPQANLMLITPGALAPGLRYAFPARERKSPIRISASLRSDRVVIALPAGLKVDEAPEYAELRTPYGTYRSSYRIEAGKLTFEQTLETPDAIFPAAEYGKLRAFFDEVAGRQNSAVVLAK